MLPGGLGHDLDIVSGQPRPPAQVEVVPEDVVAAVEPAEAVHGRSPDQHPGGRDEQRPSLLVALTLIEFTLVDPGVHPTGQVDGRADRLEQLRVVPLAQLRADDGQTRIRLQRRHEELDGVRLELEVVMQQQHERRGPRGPGVQCHRHGTTEAQVAVSDQDTVLTEPVEQQLTGPVTTGVVDRDDLDMRMCLRGERRQGAR